jgi:hypothetical protein
MFLIRSCEIYQIYIKMSVTSEAGN